MSYTNLRVHFIWSTRNREKLIQEDMEPKLYAYIGGILRKRKHVLLDANGVEDHIHLLVGMHQSQSIADCVRDLKSNSSSWVHKNYPALSSFAWQTKYGAFSVSESSVPKVKAYLKNQKDHHMEISYQVEFLKFLKQHDIKIDERFVFE